MRHKMLVALSSGALMIAAVSVMDFEGRSLDAYLDPVGIPTICDGVTPGVKLGDTATDLQCDKHLADHLIRTLGTLTDCIDFPLNKNEWAALTSWAYNVGTGAACSSTLVRYINEGRERREYCAELLRWTYAGGQQLNGLIRRRQSEYLLCMRNPEEPQQTIKEQKETRLAGRA